MFNWVPPSSRLQNVNGIPMLVGYSAEGTQVGRVDLLSIPAISHAIEVKSNDVSQIPLRLYLKSVAGRQRIDAMTLAQRLAVQPNRFMNAVQFWKLVTMQATIGEAFIDVRDPTSWHLLPFGSAVRYTTPGGEVRYATTMNSQQLQAAGLPEVVNGQPNIVMQQDFAYNDVLHLFTFQDEYGQPIPMRSRFRHVLKLASDLYVYTCNVYNRGGAVVGYLSTDKVMDEKVAKEKIRWWRRLFKSAQRDPLEDGDGSDMRISLIDNGIKFNTLNLSPHDIQLLEAKKDLQLDFSQITGMPLWKLGVVEDYSYAGGERAQHDYIASSLNPLLCQIEAEVNTKCLLGIERQVGMYAEFDRETLVTLDAKTMAEVDDLALKNGSMTANQWAARRNLPAVAGGDLRMIPVNVDDDNYKRAKEALTLEEMQLQNALLKRQLETPLVTTAPDPAEEPDPASEALDDAVETTGAVVDADNPADAAEDPAEARGGSSGNADRVSSPDPAPADPADDDLAGCLELMQAGFLSVMTPDVFTDAEAFGRNVRKIAAEVGQRHGVADHLDGFATGYITAAGKRLAAMKPDAIQPEYEVNRAINAMNHEALRLAHGVTAKVRWVGGPNDGKVRTLGEAWEGSLRHPPLNPQDVRSFLVRQKA